MAKYNYMVIYHTGLIRQYAKLQLAEVARDSWRDSFPQVPPEQAASIWHYEPDADVWRPMDEG